MYFQDYFFWLLISLKIMFDFYQISNNNLNFKFSSCFTELKLLLLSANTMKRMSFTIHSIIGTKNTRHRKCKHKFFFFFYFTVVLSIQTEYLIYNLFFFLSHHIHVIWDSHFKFERLISPLNTLQWQWRRYKFFVVKI